MFLLWFKTNKQTNKGICDMGSHFFGGIKRIDLVRVYIIHRYSQTVCLKAVLATDSGAVVCCASDSFFHQQVSWTVWPPAALPIHYAYTHRLQRCHWVSVCVLSLSPSCLPSLLVFGFLPVAQNLPSTEILYVWVHVKSNYIIPSLLPHVPSSHYCSLLK